MSSSQQQGVGEDGFSDDEVYDLVEQVYAEDLGGLLYPDEDEAARDFLFREARDSLKRFLSEHSRSVTKAFLSGGHLSGISERAEQPRAASLLQQRSPQVVVATFTSTIMHSQHGPTMPDHALG